MWRLPQTSVILGWVSVGVCFVLATVLFVPASRGQLYIGGEAGWTGLSDQTDTISDMTSATARFYPGFNSGVRGGYEWGPWRFEKHHTISRKLAAAVLPPLLGR